MAFVLAAAGPLLRRAPPFARWVLSLALIGWFVVLTRAEPSVLRAGVMAGLGATAFALGRQRDPVRLLAVAVIGLVLLDPLLVWSVGFWLSVGATFGVTALGPPLAARLHRLGPLALPVAITLGAQLGVAVPSVLVFCHSSGPSPTCSPSRSPGWSCSPVCRSAWSPAPSRRSAASS